MGPNSHTVQRQVASTPGNWTIRLSHKISAIGITGVLGVVLIGGIYLYREAAMTPSRDAATRARTISELASKTRIDLLETRRYEKNFLMRSTDVEANKQLAASAALTADLDALRGIIPTGGELADSVARMGDRLKAYQTAFDTVAVQKRKLGLDEKSGLEGKLRDAVHGIETMVELAQEPALVITMLMMWRHEKDFMLRRDAKYLDNMKARIVEFTKQIEAASFPDNLRANLKLKLADYQRDFFAWSDSAQATATALDKVVKTSRGIEPLIETISTAVAAIRIKAEQQSAATAEQTKSSIEIEIALVALLVLAAGYLVGRSVSRSLKAMTAAMVELANGNFDVVLPGLGRGDEVGEIAHAVELFKVNAVKKAQDEARPRPSRMPWSRNCAMPTCTSWRIHSKPRSARSSTSYPPPRPSWKPPPRL
jgi:methyl-accepting chemotaxis protein